MLALRYNQIDSGEDAQEEFGWKLVHGDVFRLISNEHVICHLKLQQRHSNIQF